MRELELVSVTDDGHLVLTGADHQQFRLVVDDRVRAAVRGDRARFAQLQIPMETTVRPREIQARIRAGQTAEEIAEEAGVAVEAIRRYEGPILAERAWIAEQAQAVVPHRSAGQTSTLRELVTHRLAQRGLGADTVEWDAWRAEDTVWTVQASFASGRATRGAIWRFDPARRTVLPADEDALWLTEGEDALAVASGRRLSAVARPSEQPPADPSTPSAGTSAGAPSGASRVDGFAGGTDADGQDARLAEEPGDDQSDRLGEAVAGGPGGAGQGQGMPTGGASVTAGRARARSRGRRASVPSWDDILLGTRRPD
jgi:hypothetical protein